MGSAGAEAPRVYPRAKNDLQKLAGRRQKDRLPGQILQPLAHDAVLCTESAQLSDSDLYRGRQRAYSAARGRALRRPARSSIYLTEISARVSAPASAGRAE